MDNNYFLSFSSIKQCWNVASDHARRYGKKNTKKCSLTRTALAIAGVLMMGSLQAADLPTNGQIKLGNGKIVQLNDKQMQILQNSGNLVINWDSFDIGMGNSVDFKQPDANSIALNRVVGSDGSRIMGNLTSNGRVFLVNPNGVLFGKSAKVDVGGLVASTLDLDIKDEDLGNKLRFKGRNNLASVVNQGEIIAKEGGAIALLGGQVSNQGKVAANRGTVTLAAGQAISLVYANTDNPNVKYGPDVLYVNVDEGALNALVENQGLLKADGGSVKLAAGGVATSSNILRTVVNNQGVIEANSLQNSGGRIYLDGGKNGTVLVNGRLEATNVNATNNVLEQGRIDVRGQNVVLNGQMNTSSSQGNAGEIYVRASDKLQAAGSLNASSVGGNGGNISARGKDVEVDSKIQVNVTGAEGKNGYKGIGKSDNESILAEIKEAKDKANAAAIKARQDEALQKQKEAKEAAEKANAECCGQLILATALDCSRNSRSDSFGVKPPLYQWGLSSL